jgi:hypothetical protein
MVGQSTFTRFRILQEAAAEIEFGMNVNVLCLT